jgi:hypothetical protein
MKVHRHDIGKGAFRQTGKRLESLRPVGSGTHNLMPGLAYEQTQHIHHKIRVIDDEYFFRHNKTLPLSDSEQPFFFVEFFVEFAV